MTNRDELIEKAFSPERAETYDAQFEPLAPIKDLMHLVLRVAFAELPPDARVLVVGAGTAAEVRFLAPIFPGWRFTLVDPAEGMLAVARRHLEAEGIMGRCALHVGYLDSCDATEHDAATSILVSHFLTDAGDRRAFFADIAARLKPGGLLFDADLAAHQDDPSFDSAMELWMRMVRYSAQGGSDGFMNEDVVSNYREMFGRDFAAHDPDAVEAMIADAGFGSIVRCYRAVLIQGWLARRI